MASRNLAFERSLLQFCLKDLVGDGALCGQGREVIQELVPELFGNAFPLMHVVDKRECLDIRLVGLLRPKKKFDLGLAEPARWQVETRGKLGQLLLRRR